MIVSILILVASAFDPEPLLLKKATKIMDVPSTWREGVLTQGNYNWWTRDRIVAFLFDPSALLRVDKKQVYDLRGKKVWDPVPGWLFHYAVNDFSPDRSLSISESWNKMQLTWTVFKVRTHKTVGSWTITSHTGQPQLDQSMGYWPPKVQWSADGKSIYQIETWPGKDTLLAQVTQRPLSNLSKGRAFPVTSTFEWDADVMVHDGKALVRQYNSENAFEFPMQEWQLNQPGSTVKNWTLHAPGGRVFIEYIPSPDMKKAVWVMGVPSTKVGGMGSDGYPFYALSLWSSGLRGENMRELGAISFRSRKSEDLMDEHQSFGEVEWNPDGRHVSFIYSRKLYWIEA